MTVWPVWAERLCPDCEGKPAPEPEPEPEPETDDLSKLAAEMALTDQSAGDLLADRPGTSFAIAEPAPKPCTRCGALFARWTDDP